MKILVVSAHYPPNFISGGTIAPQRVARGLQAAGHDVEVFAGWLGDRPPLSTWTEVDETGLSVHWLATTPWTAWNDERNFANPDVAKAFADRLATSRPDLVHFHSLQSMGGGLVEVAADAGAATAVTMHDFWWVCARQFLVDREFRPCCPVVDAGCCPCEVDAVWLADRNARLARALERADLVLAVSESSRRLLAANGVAAGVLEVDENGLPSAHPRFPGATPARPSSSERLRLLFAGGSDRMKGGHVLLEALASVERFDRWSLTAVDLRPLAEDLGFDTRAMDVEWRPGYQPEEAAHLFAASDVVVVPSVMRESHSILTREALLHGCAVVVTDTFGPEEVVEHGLNGLVVPAGDPAGLAAALSQLVDDPALVARMREAAPDVRVRTIDEQIASLDQRFRRLVAERGTVSAASGRAIRRVLFIVGIEGAPLRYRARLPAEALALLGVESDVRHYRDPEAWRLAFESDAVVAYRVPATHQVLQLLEALGREGIARYFDVDDLIFDPDLRDEIPALKILSGPDAALWLEGVARYRTTMEACDAFIGSTEALCRHAEDVVGLPAFRFANGTGLLLARAADRALQRERSPGPFRFGYLSGTDTHDHDWRFIEPAAIRFLEDNPDTELWIGGLLRVSAALDPFASRIRRLPLLPWSELPAVLRDLDVNLAPLEPGSRFNDAKSAIKWLEAAMVETPTIASPTEPFRASIRSGENGLLAETVEEWVSSLQHLHASPAERKRLGARARRDALLEWSPHLQGRRYLEILSSPLPARRASGSWSPVALDEPWAPGRIPLDPYAVAPEAADASPLSPPVPRTVTRRAAVVVRTGFRSARAEGLLPTTRRSIGWARRRWPRARAGLRRRLPGSR